MSKESAKPVEILTEEELEEIIGLVEYDIEEGHHTPWFQAKILLAEINRLKELEISYLSANAELSFKNMKLTEALIRERNDAVIWDSVTVFSRIDKLLEELK